MANFASMWRPTNCHAIPLKKWPSLLTAVAALSLLCILVVYQEEVAELQYLFNLQDVLLSPHRRPRIVVSMTTFSERIFVTGMHAIRSILKQPHDRFIITIPIRGTREAAAPSAMCAHFGDCVPLDSAPNSSTISTILAFLEASRLGNFVLAATRRHPIRRAIFENARQRMTLQFLLDSDPYGPATKVLGALLLERNPKTVIITVDDDITYDPSLLQVLSTHIPNHAALCPACQTRSPLSPDTGPKGMIHDGSWHRWFWAHNAKACPGWLVGWAGVAYRVGYFGPDVFNISSMPAACFLNDDVWLSGYLRRRGVGLLVMPGIRGGRQYRHPTLSLSVRPDYEHKDMDPCIRFWENQQQNVFHNSG